MNAPIMTMIPQADPGAGYRAQKAEMDAAVARALASGWYILGKEGAAFEEEYAAWLGTKRAIGCANGTDALALILRGLGIGPGMSVATVSHTAVATVAAIEMVGATPLLLDIDPDTYTMDADELLSVIDHPPPGLPPLRAVIPVHIYGQACDLVPMLEATRAAGIALIEDCAQCHGATLNGAKLGTLGTASAFSLYPTKNLGALGDGGVLATNDDALADLFEQTGDVETAHHPAAGSAEFHRMALRYVVTLMLLRRRLLIQEGQKGDLLLVRQKGIPRPPEGPAALKVLDPGLDEQMVLDIITQLETGGVGPAAEEPAAATAAAEVTVTAAVATEPAVVGGREVNQ